MSSPHQPEFDYAHPVDAAPASVAGVPAHNGHAPDIAQTRGPEYSEWDPRSAPGTYVLLTINIVVFLWMTLHGVPWMQGQTTGQLLHFGANSAGLVLNHGQWWRLLSATFVHIGIIHIATNMWCLWNLGLLGEPLLGPWGMVAVYVLTGVAGNLLSVGWDVASGIPAQYLDQMVGAGASGAVFGIAGILIVLLSNRKLPIPWTELKRLRTSVVRFALINLVIGASTILPMLGSYVRIDNSAHIGGFLCGLALGPGLVPRMTAGRAKYLARQRSVFAAAAFVLALAGYWVANFK
jgi:rhomboid protease GluP